MLSTLLNQSKLVYWPSPVGQSNMHIRLDFCPRLARKETNVALLKENRRAYCSNLFTVPRMEWEAVIVTAARSSVDIVIALCRAEASLERSSGRENELVRSIRHGGLRL